MRDFPPDGYVADVLAAVRALPPGGSATYAELAAATGRAYASVCQAVKFLAYRKLVRVDRTVTPRRVSAADPAAPPAAPRPLPAPPPPAADPAGPPTADDLAVLRRRLAVEELVLARLKDVTDRLTLTDAGLAGLAVEKGALARSIRLLRDLADEIAAAREAAETCLYMDNI